MALKLYLLRHGLAAQRGLRPGSDAERPLTAKGRRKLGQVAQAMKDLGLSFDLILSSPYLRARQTAEIVAETLHADKRLRFSNALTPQGSFKELLSELQAAGPTARKVLLVGHEPYLSELSALLLSGETGLRLTFRKAGLCKLLIETLRPGRCACLEWLLTPKQMARMNEK